ncbi:MAG TPA: hypothetical protein VF796_29875 [Humisphaera sp.]
MSVRASVVRCFVRGLLAVPAAGLLALAGGCAVLTPGTEIIDHQAGRREQPIEAPSDGIYVLYPKYGDVRPLKEAVMLRKGDAIGFETGATGEITAVAGQDKWTFDDVPMLWKRKD